MFFPTPTVAHWRYLLMSSEESRSQYRVWISWYRSLYNRFLDATILKASSSRVLFPKFWCKQYVLCLLTSIPFKNHYVYMCTPMSFTGFAPAVLCAFKNYLRMECRFETKFQTITFSRNSWCSNPFIMLWLFRISILSVLL